MPIHETEFSAPPSREALAVDAAVQAQVALRLVAGLLDHLTDAGVLAHGEAARIAECAARRTEIGAHSQRAEIAAALRRIVVA
ncbi:MAG: hypothetical protein ACK4YQ_01355 [Phenylobacterium sp.]|uniref:hypothetical protein n=1 Tax=Phenylobacterium sp. TaxID=1871053 RepID=UPI00391DD36A